ncbi:MAG: phosphoglycerate mutase, partial [Desulfofustis sp.]|nr:phosphoglycerate mutase [Desulfofustis sp.]
MPFDYITDLLEKSNKKIVLLIMDGVGGLPIEAGGKTELETARTPNMDRLATEGSLGRTIPVRPGVTPGSGPAHLSLFGYDPIEYQVGRGALEACGIGEKIVLGDVAVRCNFCTIDAAGNITDRRAGRISTEEALPIVDKLNTIKVPGVDVVVRQVKEYRFAVIMRGAGLSAEIEDTDPQTVGVPPLPITAHDPKAEKTAGLFRQWAEQAKTVLADEPKANFFTMRG